MAITDEQAKLAAKFLHSKGYRGVNGKLVKIAEPYPLDDSPADSKTDSASTPKPKQG